MNQKLSDWASLAEIVSGIAVVVTLIFLVVGIKENTDVVRATAYSSSIDSLNNLSAVILNNPETLRVWSAYINEDASNLEELDIARLTQALLITFRTYEKAYFSRKYSLIGVEEWSRFERQICANRRRVKSAGMEDLLQDIMTSEFMRYTTDLCAGRIQ